MAERENISKITPQAMEFFKGINLDSDYTAMKRLSDIFANMSSSSNSVIQKISKNINALNKSPRAKNISMEMSWKNAVSNFTNAYANVLPTLNSSFTFEYSADDAVIAHELGHSLYSIATNETLPDNYDAVMSQAQESLNNNKEYVSVLLDEAATIINRLKHASEEEALAYIQTHTKEIEEIIEIIINNQLVGPTSEQYNSKYMNVEQLAKEVKLNEVQQQELLAKCQERDLEFLREKLKKLIQFNIEDTLLFNKRRSNSEAQYYDLLTGIIDSIYSGKNPYKEKYEKYNLRGHSSNYLNQRETKAFDEQFADYIALETCPSIHKSLEGILKSILGQEWFTMMETKTQEVAINLENINKGIPTNLKVENNLENINEFLNLDKRIEKASSLSVESTVRKPKTISLSTAKNAFKNLRPEQIMKVLSTYHIEGYDNSVASYGKYEIEGGDLYALLINDQLYNAYINNYENSGDIFGMIPKKAYALGLQKKMASFQALGIIGPEEFKKYLGIVVYFLDDTMPKPTIEMQTIVEDNPIVKALKRELNTRVKEKFKRLYSEYVEEEQLDNLFENVNCYDTKVWEQMAERHVQGMYKDRKIYIHLTRDKTFQKILGVSTHEGLHQISERFFEKSSGIRLSQEYKGLNEVITELINKQDFPEYNHRTKYDRGIIVLKKIMTLIPELNMKTIRRIYMTNNIDELREIINNNADVEIFDSVLVPAFNGIISSDHDISKKSEIDIEKVIRNQIANNRANYRAFGGN